MRFGLYVNPSSPGPDHDGRRIQEVLSQCRLAEELGLNSIWLTEQHFTPYNTYSDSLVLAGHLAALTPKMRLGFAVIVPSMHNPVRLAEQLGLIDQLTGGRLVVGLGVGAGAIEMAGYGRVFEERHELFEEAAELLIKLWQHESGVLEINTPHYQGRIDGRILPRPVQSPHPLLARATGDAARAESWGERGQPVMLGSRGVDWLASMLAAHDRGLAKSGLSEAQKEAVRDAVAIHHVVYVAATDEQARAEFQPFWDQHLVYHYHANRSIKLTFDELPKDHVARYTGEQLIAGSPETVIRELKQYEAIGIRQHMIWANVGNAADDLVQRSLRLFAKEVMPAFA